MATTITKPETLFGKRMRRQEDPRLITGTALYLDDIKMPGMHHAIVVRSPHGAAKIKGIDTKAALGHAGRGGGVHRRGREASGRGAVRARRCPDCACRIIICWRRTASTSWAIRWPWWWPPTATSRATRRTWSKWTTKNCRPWPIPRRRSPPGAPAVHPEWPDNVAFTFHQEGGDIDQAFRDAEVIVTPAHHQPAADSHRDGDARRGRGVARRREIADPVFLHADPAPAAHAGGGDSGHAGESAARDHAGSGRRLRVEAERLRRRGADGVHRHEDRQAGEVGGIAAREFPVHDPRARPRGLFRAGGQTRRHHAGPAG